MAPEIEYEVALSFAGEERAFVQRVAEILKEAGARVFFDDFETVALWGHDLAAHFDEVFRWKARYVVPFVSSSYAAKAWPRHEFHSALARAVQEREPYLLPVRFDATDLPGLSPTVAYLDATALGPDEVAGVILQKLGRAPGDAGGAGPSARAPKAPAAGPSPERRARFEEAYAAAHQYCSHLTTFFLYYVPLLKGQVDLNQVNDRLIKEGVSMDKTVYPRLEMLLGVDFPGVLPAFGRLIEHRDKMNAIIGEYRREYDGDLQEEPQLARQFVRLIAGLDSVERDLKDALVREFRGQES